MTRVVFIGGAMRSGTTLLGSMLGAHERIFNAGELSLLWRGVAENDTCSCGRALRACPLWGEALLAAGSSATTRSGAADLARRSATYFRLRHLGTLHRRSLDEARPDPALSDLVHTTGAVLAEAMRLTDSSTIVDTSKRVSWLHFHRMSDPGNTPGLIHVVRDPRGVVASSTRVDTTELWSRDPGAPAATGTTTATVAWLAANAVTSIAGRWTPRRSVILYEELVSNPGTTLQTISRRLGVPVVDPTNWDGTLPHYETHVVAGNPHRLERAPQRLVPDHRWQQQLSARQRRSVTIATAPLRKTLEWQARIQASAAGPAEASGTRERD